MFKNHPDPMRMEPTPERVLAVCKMIEKQPMSKEELVQTMTLGGDNPDVNASINVALEELHIIDQIDGKLKRIRISCFFSPICECEGIPESRLHLLQVFQVAH